MSFIEGFYSFNIQLNDTRRGIYRKFRIKTARHQLEPLPHLYARILTFTFQYDEEMEFSSAWDAEKDPSMSRKNVIGEFISWIEVGCPNIDKLQRALRLEDCSKQVFFYAPEQITQFCHYMRGSTQNWVENVTFYEIDAAILQNLIEHRKSASYWSATIVDNVFYLVFDEIELETEIRTVDIWQRYQESIANTAVS